MEDSDCSVGSEIEVLSDEQAEQSGQEDDGANQDEREAGSSGNKKQLKSKSKINPSSAVQFKKTNTNVPKSSSFLTKLSTTMKANQISPVAGKSRSDKRRAALLRSAATDLYQSSITSHFKILDDIETLSKKNKELREQLKGMLLKFNQQRDEFSAPFTPAINPNESETTDHMSLLRRMMNQALSQSRKRKRSSL